MLMEIPFNPCVIQEAVLTAVEAMLVSLYGYRSPESPGPLHPDGTPAPDPLHPDASAEHNRRSSDGEHFSHDTPLPLSTDVVTCPGTDSVTSVERQSAANSSSSSSVAEDWVVNPFDPSLLNVGLSQIIT